MKKEKKSGKGLERGREGKVGESREEGGRRGKEEGEKWKWEQRRDVTIYISTGKYAKQ